MKPSEMASSSNYILQNRKERPNWSTNNGDMMRFLAYIRTHHLPDNDELRSVLATVLDQN